VTGMRYGEPRGAKPRDRSVREGPAAPPAERYYGGFRAIGAWATGVRGCPPGRRSPGEQSVPPG